MRTNQIVKFSLILFLFSTFIFSFSYFGASALSARSAENQVFSENTMIGSINVSNRSAEEANTDIKTKVNNWISKASISLFYKGEAYPVAASSVLFLVEDSVSAAKNGEQNELFVEFKDTALNNPALPASVKNRVDFEKLESGLQAAVQKLPPVIEINLEDYLPAEEPVIISTAAVKLSPGEGEVWGIIEGFSPIEILPESMFSLGAYAKETGQAEGSATAFSQIASALYKAFLPTNMTISERHISSQLPSNIELGFEAKVDFANNIDLKIFNSNESVYKIEFSIKEQELQVTVTGAPQIYEYKITGSGKEEFKPRVIEQFSSLLKEGQKSIEREGKAGLLIKVNREIYGENGELLKRELISEDFYPPVHRIEVLPLKPAVLPVTPDSAGSEDTVSIPGSDQNTSTPGPANRTTPSAPDNNSVQQQQSDNEGNLDVGQNTDTGGLWGKPNEQPK